MVNSLSKNQLCFYSGAIINHTDSLASVSTCGGLVNVSAVSLCVCVCVFGLVNRCHMIQFKQLGSYYSFS